MTNNQLTDSAPVTDEELDQMIRKLERDGGMVPKMLSLMRELREVRKAKREPVADVVAWSSPNEERICDIRWRRFDVAPGPLYSAPPARPVAVPEGLSLDDAIKLLQKHVPISDAQCVTVGWEACRAAMCATDKASNHAVFHGKCSENCATAPEQSGTTHAQEPVQSVDHVDGESPASIKAASALVSSPKNAASPSGLPASVVDALEKALQAMSFMGDVLNNLDAVCEEDVEYVSPAFEAVRSALENNSPVIPDGWIPVSERMPELGEDVLVSKEFFGPGDWRIKVGHIQSESKEWHVYGATWIPTHWQPLPEPPKEVG